MSEIHLDTDFLVTAVSEAGPERRRLLAANATGAAIRMCAIAWYEFTHGPRSAEQVAVARFFVDDIIPFDERLIERASEVFRALDRPRRRGNDIAIGVTAAAAGARLLTLNPRDFIGIPGLSLDA